MEDWQKDFLVMVQSVTVEVEEFFQNVSQAVEEIAGQVEVIIVTDIEEFFQDLFDVSLDIYVEEETSTFDDSSEDTDFFLNPKIEPSLETHPACLGCLNYHGRIYNGNLLVCGMHPYGWDGEICPDWEG
jgi:hypothetical protein